MPTCVSSSMIRRRASGPAGQPLVQREAFGDLLFQRVQRVERGHRLLEDEADVVAAHPAQLGLGGADHLGAVVFDRPVDLRLSGNSDTVDSAVTDLPDPLSPTSATVSPSSTWKVTPFTAWAEAHRPARKEAHAGPDALTSASLIAGDEGLPRVEGVAHALEDEDQQRQHDREGEEGGEAEPGRLQVLLGLQRHLAQRRRRGRQAEAEEVERGQRPRSCP
jgi:hypothetical protein